jgi:hypothetical protein
MLYTPGAPLVMAAAVTDAAGFRHGAVDVLDRGQ